MAKKAAAEIEKNHVPASETLTTAVHFPRRTWELLRAVAFHRAQSDGGRASVSKLLTTLVEQRRTELEREAKRPIE
jgi:hypothetical protein